jgi:putative hydrolase of the HAD superfamily
MLIFDADDTLWENNILFERVIGDFLDWVNHPALDRAEVRVILDDIERANSRTHGYGTKVLLRSLHECFEHLQERQASEDERGKIISLAASLINHQVELMPGVRETLADLAERHTLLLLSKGDAQEQQRKLASSRLSHNFKDIYIVPEKNVDTYRTLVERRELSLDSTWMIGNSPRSDIRPARAAGLRAVFIPHPHTWILEHDDIDDTDDRIITLGAFPELLDYF